jgi:hypothetical protein
VQPRMPEDTPIYHVVSFHLRLKWKAGALLTMHSSKDEGGEGSGLSVVNGKQSADPPRASEAGADKTTTNKLAVLRQEHRELDDAIQAMIAEGPLDQLMLTRLKKKKLMLRDQITRIEDDILPDIIA